MANFYKDNEDLQYYVKRGIDWKPVVDVLERRKELDGFADVKDAVQFYEEIAEMMGAFAADEMAPFAAEVDASGVIFKDGEASFSPRIQEIFDKLTAMDMNGLCMPRDLGGMNAPLILYLIVCELLSRAECSVMAHWGFTAGIAVTLLSYSIEEGSTEIDPTTRKLIKTRFDKEIAEVLQGKASGAMDITEPHAGSDMAQLKTAATQDQNGQWWVTGQKIFITSGHGKYHLVVARTEKAARPDDPMAGLEGLSLFLVPAWEERDGKRIRHITIDRIEEKLGHHGSITAAINIENAPAQLIGKRGEGFKYMLVLMNGARLAVGFEAVGLCEAAYRAAKAYAAERVSMGKSIDRHEMIADMLEGMQTSFQGVRAMTMRAAWYEEMAHMLHAYGCLEPDAAERAHMEKESKRYKHEARRLTPLVKFLGAEMAVAVTRDAIQVMGGNGFMRDYPVEKLHRDALLLPIYEGTSQIQALMVVKDSLGAIMKNPRRFVRKLAEARWRSLSARDGLERRFAKITLLSLGAQQHLIARTAGDKFRAVQGKPITEWPRQFLKNWDPKRDFAFAMLHAARLTELLAHDAVVEALFEQAKKHTERRELLERYLDRCETRCRCLHDEITTTGSRLLRKLGASQPAPAARAAE